MEPLRSQRKRAIGVVGTVGRLALGLVFLYWAFGAEGVRWSDLILGLIGFPITLLLWQRLRLHRTTEPLRATGPVGFAVNCIIALALFLIPFTRVATLLFYGISLLLAAVRGYAGCEVLAISNWLLRRDDQVGCVVFSPLDAIEARITDGTSVFEQ